MSVASRFDIDNQLEVERLRSIIADLMEAIGDLLNNIGGHNHWDKLGTAGRNCPICHQQLAASERARAALAKGKEGK